MRQRFVFTLLCSAALAGTSSASPLALHPMTSFGGGDGLLVTGDRPYLTTGDFQRGMAYNATNNHLYVLSRNTGTGAAPEVAILDGDTGAELNRVTLTGLTGGLFLANKIRVADDGAIYVSNLTTSTSAANPFKVYRFGSEADLLTNTKTVALNSQLTVGTRVGDAFNIRGSGTNTQMVFGGGTSNNDVIVATTGDGSNFTPTIFDIGGAGDNQRLGVAFGDGDTIFAKGSQNLIRIGFNLAGPSASILNTYPTTTYPSGSGPIDVEPNLDVLSTVVVATPDATRLYDVSNVATIGPSQILDFETWGPDNSNAVLLGESDFGSWRLYVLNTNNGVQAFLIPEPGAISALAVSALTLGLRRRKN